MSFLSLGRNVSKKINKILNKRDSVLKNSDMMEGSNLIICKILTEKLGGKIWASTDEKVGNSVYFTFRIDSDNDDISSFEEEMDISDYSSSKDAVSRIPSMHCNEPPFAMRASVVGALQSEGKE